MNPDYERQLEARIDRELKQLGELSAPATLASRVMRVIEQRAALPWYRRSWQTWPLGLRAASLASLLAMFGALCWGMWELTRSGAMAAGVQKFVGEFAGLDMILKTLGVLGNALVLAIQNLGTGYIVGGVIMLLTAYVACVGLGTVYVRLAMARR